MGVMHAALTENIQEKLAGYGTDHYDRDCQEGLKGNQGSVRIRNQHEDIKEHKRFWLPYDEAVIRLRNHVVFIKRRAFNMKRA